MKKANALQVRQGDVLLTPAPKPIGELRPRTRQDRLRIVLALGEATGHAHALVLEQERDAQLWEDDKGALWLEVLAPSRVVHEDHGTSELAPAWYQVENSQREYNVAEERRVLD